MSCDRPAPSITLRGIKRQEVTNICFNIFTSTKYYAFKSNKDATHGSQRICNGENVYTSLAQVEITNESVVECEVEFLI